MASNLTSFTNRTYVDIYGESFYYDPMHRVYVSDSTCNYQPGALLTVNAAGAGFALSGLPIHLSSPRTEAIRSWVIASFFTFVTVGLILHSVCAQIIYKNSNLSRGVKFILLIDVLCRLLEAFIHFYFGTCVCDWHCVSETGTIPGILINRIVSSIATGIFYAMQLFLHCLSLNRIFAVFFIGSYYKRAEILLIPYTIGCFVIPNVYYFLGIGNLKSDAETICYAGPFFSPADWFMKGFYSISPFFNYISYTIDYIVFGFTVLALVLDMIVAVKIRFAVGTSNKRRRADIRLLIMMLITGSIWMWDDIIHIFVKPIFVDYWRFFFTRGEPFLGRCVLSLITILFHLPSRNDQKVTQVSTLSAHSKATKQ